MSPRPEEFSAPSSAPRRVVRLIAIAGVVVGTRQAIDVALRATVPTWSAATMLFVETLTLTALYGVIAWWLVVLPASRRPAPSLSGMDRNPMPVLVRADTNPATRGVATTSQRHLRLVPDTTRG